MSTVEQAGGGFLRNLFRQARSAKDQAQAAVDAERQGIAELRQRRIALAAMPAAKGELLAAALALLDKPAQDLRDQLARDLARLARAPGALTDPGTVQRSLGITMHPAQFAEPATCGLLETVAITLNRSAIEALLRQVVDGLDIPDDTPTTAQRTAELARIDEEIRQREERLTKLYEEAEAAGIALD